MPSPKLILEAEQATAKAIRAATSLGAEGETQEGLFLAEHLMAEIRHFAYGVGETGVVGHAEASRVLSAILGFEVNVRTVAAGLNDLEGYKRLPR